MARVYYVLIMLPLDAAGVSLVLKVVLFSILYCFVYQGRLF